MQNLFDNELILQNNKLDQKEKERLNQQLANKVINQNYKNLSNLILNKR